MQKPHDSGLGIGPSGFDPGFIGKRNRLGIIGRHGERYFEPEVQRVMGSLLLQTGRGAAEALPWLEDAVATARELQLPGLALRAALALAPVWAEGGRRSEALALLDEALAAVGEGAGTRDVVQAQALLQQLRR